MDLSDGSRLLKTFNLNKALESLSCNEDSNAAVGAALKLKGIVANNRVATLRYQQSRT